MAYEPEILAQRFKEVTDALVKRVNQEDVIAEQVRQQKEAYLQQPVELRIYLRLGEMIRLWDQPTVTEYRLTMDRLIYYLTDGTVNQCPASILDRIEEAMTSLPLRDIDTAVKLLLPKQLSFSLMMPRVEADRIQRMVPHSVFTELVRRTRLIEHGQEKKRSKDSEAETESD